MLHIAGKTAGPIGLKFVVDTQWWPGSVIDFFFKFFFTFFFNGQRRALQQVFFYIKNKTFVYMLCIAGQTAGPIGQNFFSDMHGDRGVL